MAGYLPDWLRFASDATLGALWGGGFVIAAILALFMERRRHRRDRVGRPDQVGWVPWTGLFLGCALVGVGLLAASLPHLLKG